MAYGYVAPTYGAGSLTQKPRTLQTSPLTKAVQAKPSYQDPFGLTPQPSTPQIDGTLTAPKAPAPAPPQVQGPVSTAPTPAQPQTQQPAAQAYDINTDPALQATNAYTAMSDEQAQAQFERQRRDALLQFGDQELVRKLTGDESLAQAAEKNPTSTKKTLGVQKDTQLSDLLRALTTGGHNLGYSGYRLDKEGEVGRNYEDALAQAASGVSSGIEGLRSSLLAALMGSKQARAQALGDAFGRARQGAIDLPPVGAQQGTTAGDTPFSGATLSGLPLTAPDYLSALMLAARANRPVAL